MWIHCLKTCNPWERSRTPTCPCHNLGAKCSLAPLSLCLLAQGNSPQFHPLKVCSTCHARVSPNIKNKVNTIYFRGPVSQERFDSRTHLNDIRWLHIHGLYRNHAIRKFLLFKQRLVLLHDLVENEWVLHGCFLQSIYPVSFVVHWYVFQVLGVDLAEVTLHPGYLSQGVNLGRA